MQLLTLLTLLGAGTAFAQQDDSDPKRLFVTSYAGTLSTLELSTSGPNGAYQLQNLSVDLGCQPSPSQLVVDKKHGALFCIGENAAGGNGSLTSYNINNGTLAKVANSQTFPGPVYGALYGTKQDPVRPLVLAHYGDAGLSTYKIANDLTFSPILPNITFPKPRYPGKVADSQSVSHPHSAILDPTGQYVVVADLGLDLVKVFSHDSNTGALKEAGAPLTTNNGTGPRHAAFSVQGNTTFMYVVAELDASLTAYSVKYLDKGAGLQFTQVWAGDTLGGQKPTRKVAPAEVRIAPDNKYLIVSNRNDSSFQLANPDPKNATQIPSDTLATYAIQPDGKLNFVQLWPAGGLYARSIDINKKGDLVAVGLQLDSRVVVFKRDPAKGTLDVPVAWYGNNGTGQVTAVKWDE